MQTRSTSSIEGFRRAAIVLVLSALLAVPGCKDDPTPVAQTECRTGQFRLCDVECGRGVQQCLETGVWSECACVLLDAGRPDSRSSRDASDGEASDAAGEGEAGDGALDPDGTDSPVLDSPPE